MTEQRERKRLSKVLHDGLQQYLVAAKMELGGVIHKRHSDMRIIGLSLDSEEERAKEMLDAGATFYVTQSGPPADLKAAIRACMHKAEEAKGHTEPQRVKN